MTEKLKVYVGYDSREDIAWQVCRHSLIRQVGPGVTICPLRQPQLRELGLYTRPNDDSASTEFSLTRFLTPYLADSAEWSVFVDCDFLFTADLRAMVEALDPRKAVYVVQHDYQPRYQKKMDGLTQTRYPRKNWSSLMVFNGNHPAVRALTPRVVNGASPAHLHRFAWLEDDAIGALPQTWNFLVGEFDPPPEAPSAIHFTNGGPWFPEWTDVPYADLWHAERERYHREQDLVGRTAKANPV